MGEDLYPITPSTANPLWTGDILRLTGQDHFKQVVELGQKQSSLVDRSSLLDHPKIWGPQLWHSFRKEELFT